MSDKDIKMSEWFDLPISYDSDFRDECGIDHRIIQDANHKDVVSDDTQLSAGQAKATTHAINSHDALAEQNKALNTALKKIHNIVGVQSEQGACWDDEVAFEHSEAVAKVFEISKHALEQNK